MGLNHAYSQELLERNHKYQKLFETHEEVEKDLYESKKSPSMPIEEIQRLKKFKLYLQDNMRAIEQARV